MNELISVIIPAYNAEKFIEKCLRSLCAQSYNNWEAIIVDDSSTDNTLELCREFTKNDSRFTILHKENGGTSSARNYALKFIKGEYTAFVDSDDYLSEDYLKVLSDGMSDGKYDISMCGYVYELEDAADEIYRIGGAGGELGRDDIIKRMFVPLNRSWGGFAWNKLYKTSIIKTHNLLFPENQSMFEDIYFNYEYLRFCSRGYFNPVPVYHYIKQKNSLVNYVAPDERTSKKWLSSLCVFDKIIAETDNTDPEINKTMRMMKTLHASTAIRVIAASGLKSDPKYRELKKFIRKNLFSYLNYNNISAKKKLGCLLSLVAPRVAYKIWKNQ